MNQTKSNFIALGTLIKREYIRITRIWIQTLIPPAITMSLYFIIFGKLVGSQIGKLGNFTYMEFIIPGLVLMTVITNSYNNVVFSFYGTKFQKNVEEFLVSPMPEWVILLGFVSGGMIRGILNGLLVLCVSLFFTTIPIFNLPLIFAVIILSSFLFSLGGFLNALFAKSFDDTSIIPTFILTPLSYLGGVFFKIDMLPPFWKIVASFNPILYMVNAFRYGFIGESDTPLDFSLLTIVLCSVILFLINIRLMKLGYGIRS
jgi:ABC-2 type transport system permease protein